MVAHASIAMARALSFCRSTKSSKCNSRCASSASFAAFFSAAHSAALFKLKGAAAEADAMMVPTTVRAESLASMAAVEEPTVPSISGGE